MDERLVVLAIAMGYGLVEVTKAMITLILSKRPGAENGRQKNDSRIIRIEQMLEGLTEEFKIKDANGLPLWIVPRAWGEMLKELLKLHRETLELQKNIVKLLGDDGPKKKGRKKKGA